MGFNHSAESPVKVSPDCKELVEFGSEIFGYTYGEFVELCVASCLVSNQERIDEKHREMREKTTLVHDAICEKIGL